MSVDNIPFGSPCEHCGTAPSTVLMSEPPGEGVTFEQQRLVCYDCTAHYPGWTRPAVVLRRVPTSRLTQLRWIVVIAAARFFAWVRGRLS